MATKKPLVLTGGQIEQLQVGDSIEHPGIFLRTNNNAGAITVGQPVYVDGSGTVDLGQADSASTKDILGLVADVSIAASAAGGIQSDGVLAASTGQWDAITGQSGGLTSGVKYYLDPSTAGFLTTTPPSVLGEFVAPLGLATSITELEITIDTTIKL